MRKVLFFIMFICMVSCNVKNGQPSNESAIDSVPVESSQVVDNKTLDIQRHPITSIWMDFIRNNPNSMNNEMTRDKAAKELQKTIIDSINKNNSILYSIPLKYETAMEKGNKYIIKFSLMTYNSLNIDTELESAKYTIAFDLFTIGDEKLMSRLQDNEFYYIKACNFQGSVNNKITLPSGGTFSQSPSISYENSYRVKYGLNLGGLYVKDLELK